MVEGSRVAVLPGDLVHLPSASTRPGPGVILRDDSTAVASKTGLLRRQDEKAVWVHNQQKRVSRIINSRDWLSLYCRPCSMYHVKESK